mgnify:CR=1 FL=1
MVRETLHASEISRSFFNHFKKKESLLIFVVYTDSDLLDLRGKKLRHSASIFRKGVSGMRGAGHESQNSQLALMQTAKIDDRAAFSVILGLDVRL